SGRGRRRLLRVRRGRESERDERACKDAESGRVFHLLLPCEADVERRLIVAPHIDRGCKASEAVLADLDAMLARGKLHDEAIVVRWRVPPLAVDEDKRVAR